MSRVNCTALLAAALLTAPAAAVDPAALRFDVLPSRSELPDPLTMFDGTRVTTKEDWFGKRRPELKELFQQVMYGRYPAAAVMVSGRIVYEDKQALGGKATLREVAVTVADGAPPFHLLLVVPNVRLRPVPLFVGLNFTGNHTLTADPKVRLPDGWMYPNRVGVVNNKATDAGRGTQRDTWPLETIVGRGYGLATVFVGDVVPDNPAVRGGLADVAMPAAKAADPDATGAVMAWAWGLHRAVDYLLTVPEVDGKRIAVVGHSRLGKAAVVAAAFDDRIAVAMPHQAGCGGTAPDRRHNPKAEPIERINTAFPHWFCGHFKPFGADPTRLPFDQHSLVAVCAPRPVLFTNAADDQWADPPGQLDVLRAATPVYTLLGVDGLADGATANGGPLVDSRLGYWTRPGKHEMNRSDWGTFLAYADKWLK